MKLNKITGFLGHHKVLATVLVMVLLFAIINANREKDATNQEEPAIVQNGGLSVSLPEGTKIVHEGQEWPENEWFWNPERGLMEIRHPLENGAYLSDVLHLEDYYIHYKEIMDAQAAETEPETEPETEVEPEVVDLREAAGPDALPEGTTIIHEGEEPPMDTWFYNEKLGLMCYNSLTDSGFPMSASMPISEWLATNL